MTRDHQLRLPKLSFIFDFKVNSNWQEALQSCKLDGWFRRELPDVEEDLEIVLKSISILFTDCSASKLCFLAKAYMIFVHLLDSHEWGAYENIDDKMNYLKDCFNAYRTEDNRKLKELNPYFFKLISLFKDYQNDATSMNEQYSIDTIMESLIGSLNEIMLKVDCEHEELSCNSLDSLNVDEKINSYLAHNVNHYDVILSKLFFNQKMISNEIENDKLYKELKLNISKAIGIVNGKCVRWLSF